MNTQRTSGGNVTRSLPKFRLIDKDGKVAGTFVFVSDAAIWARRTWPNQQQDETRSGAGWDIEAVR